MAITRTTTTTTTSTSTQDVQQLAVGTSVTNYNLGNYVTNVGLNPYIAPRIISFMAFNMRPNATLHVFFDSVNVDQYCAPGKKAASVPANQLADWQVVERTGAWGTAVKSDANGIVYGQFNIPSATFKTGDRTLELCDVSSIKVGNDAITTSASARFTGSNLNLTTQNITLTTINPTISVDSRQNSVVAVTQVSNTVVIPDPVGNGVNLHLNINYDPIAQVFNFATPKGEAGAFVTKLDLYFKQKSLMANNGVTVYICQTDNGYPDTSRILPFSTTHLDGPSINVSDTASVATTFTFEAPVFVAANVNYAFVVKPDGNDPDILVYFANLGDIDITTGGQVYSQPNNGTAFMGATASGWTALQTEYIKYTLYRANFSQFVGDANFNNASRDNLLIKNLTYVNTTVGLMHGDTIYGAANTTPSTADTTKRGELFYFDTNKGLIYVDNVTTNFNGSVAVQVHRFANGTASLLASPNTTTLIATANLVSMFDVKTNALMPEFATLTPPGTEIRYDYTGTSNTRSVDTTAVNVVSGTETELYDYERLVVSRSNEVSAMASAKSLKIHTTFVSDSSWLSPLIDTVRADMLSISNLVDPLSTLIYDEMYNYGTALTKYVSDPIPLAAGQAAQDLQIIVSAYRPYSSYIKVYAKFVNSEDPEDISLKTWTPLVGLNDENTFSMFGNTSDFKEMTFKVPMQYRTYTLPGTITSVASSTVTGVGTTFLTDLAVGRYIAVKGDQFKKVVSIANNTSLGIDVPFTSNPSANAYLLVPPYTTAYRAQSNTKLLTGTVTTSTTTNIVTGTSTKFQTELQPGVVFATSGDGQVVVSIANNTQMTVGTPWSANNTNANGYIVTEAGLNYLNSSRALFSQFNKFQIKIVLLSDDSSKVPILDDVRAIAMQL
jgi:hypothetical protein